MLKQAFVATVAVVIGMALNYGFQFTMTRLLTPALYGELAVIIGFLAILLVPQGSIQTLMTREISKLDKKKKGEMIAFVVKKYSRLAFLASLFVAAALFFASYLISAVFSDAQLVLPIQIIAVGIPIGFLTPIVKSYYQGREKIAKLSAIMVIEPSIKLAFAFIAVFIGLSLFGATLSLWIFSIFTAALLIPLVLKKTKAFNESLKISRSFLFIVSAGIVLMIFFYLDLFFVRFHLGAEQAGYYNVASITSKVLYYTVGGSVLVFLPKSSKLHVKEKKKFRGLVLKSIAMILPIFIIFMLFPAKIISFFYTSTYVAALQPFIILSIGMFALAIFSIFLNLMWSQHMERQPLILLVAVTILDALLLNYLTPMFGLAGTAAATTISSFIFLLSSLFVVRKIVL